MSKGGIIPTYHFLTPLLTPKFDGEKDVRGPNDFSGNAGSKIDDVGEGDDDDGDDDDDTSRPRAASTATKKGAGGDHTKNGGPKMVEPPINDLQGNIDVSVSQCLL